MQTELPLRVRHLMLDANLKPSDLARGLGLSPSVVSGRLHGRSPFRVSELYRLAPLLGVTIADLMPDDDR